LEEKNHQSEFKDIFTAAHAENAENYTESKTQYGITKNQIFPAIFHFAF